MRYSITKEEISLNLSTLCELKDKSNVPPSPSPLKGPRRKKNHEITCCGSSPRPHDAVQILDPPPSYPHHPEKDSAPLLSIFGYATGKKWSFQQHQRWIEKMFHFMHISQTSKHTNHQRIFEYWTEYIPQNKSPVVGRRLFFKTWLFLGRWLNPRGEKDSQHQSL